MTAPHRFATALLSFLVLAACGGDGTADGGLADTGVPVDAARDTSVADVGTPDLGTPDTGGSCAMPDADSDGHPSMACGGDDCDDGDAARYPTNTEICDAANHDEDCDPLTFGNRDVDGDSVVDIACCNVATGGTMHCGTDCDDGNPSVNPTTSEVCNGFDDNCDGMIDEGLHVTLYPDADLDGFGAPTGSISGCPGTAGYVMNGIDCNDTNSTVHPSAAEICDGIDDNCDGVDDSALTFSVYRDLDGDGHGSHVSGTMSACTPPSGYSAYDDDCNDGNAAVHPTATEVCNSLDDNCNGLTDENLGAPCMAGVGACRGTGAVRCDGSCTATVGTADTSFHSMPAPNGSFDWDCNGTLEEQYPVGDPTATEASSAATCAPLDSTECNYGCAAGPYAILMTPSSGPGPFCGAPIWLDECCFVAVGVCGQTRYGSGNEGCR